MHVLFNKLKIISILFLTSGLASAQNQSISGYVLDSLTNEPIPYASIGIAKSYEGTAANEEGAFEFKFNCTDTCNILIGSLGYYSKSLSLSQSFDTIYLRPSVQLLNEVIILSKDISANGVVKKAIKSIKKNYITNPFVMKSFYRHYCQDTGRYTRLIESAFNLYQPNGYKKPYIHDSIFNGRLKLVQARKIINSYDNGYHPPISIRSMLADDIIGAKGDIYSIVFETTRLFLLTFPNSLIQDGFSFELDKIIQLENEEVYEIQFRKVIQNETLYSKIELTGKLYISSKTYTILRYEYDRNEIIPHKTVVEYKKYGDKYALFRIEKEWGNNNGHIDHAEVLINDILLGKSNNKYSSNITRKELANLNYDTTFWNNYNIIKRNKKEEEIAQYLASANGLTVDRAFKEEQQLDQATYIEEVKDKKTYDSLIKNNDGLLCAIFWKSSDNSYLAKDYENSKDYIQKLKEAGMRFIFVSFDNTRSFWKDYINKFGINEEYHLRIGLNVDYDYYGIESILDLPQYQLYYKRKKVNNSLPPPNSHEFVDEAIKYLDELYK